MTVVNIPGDSVEKGDAIIEYSPKYEHDQAAGVQRVVALVYEQKEKIDTSAMVKFDKVREKERKKVNQILFLCNNCSKLYENVIETT
jgi:hypothetical protein